MEVLLRHFALGFSALLPLVNPLGSALVFLGVVGLHPAGVYKALARKIALNMLLYFVVIELIGSYLLAFFGISMQIVQLAGGIVVAGIGWGLLNQPDGDPEKQHAGVEAAVTDDDPERWMRKTFYPLMFPITAGPGSLVVMVTLSAHASEMRLTESLLARAGLLVAVVLLSGLVYLCYAYAPQITAKISPSTAHGILRVIAFILLCIGVQIAWNGLEPLLSGLLAKR